ITGLGLGNKWSDCLKAYCEFQDHHGYSVERRLPTKGRPSIIAKWIRIGCTHTPKWCPAGLVPREMKEEFRRWWVSLQPDWRVKDSVVVGGQIDGDWKGLVYPGINGLLSVVACLFFWGMACDTAGDKRAWVSAFLDCTVAFRALSTLDKAT
ncbi:hypothetical protein BJ165DRAFT_1352588, partial [Panaeolus papilionaceus]